LTDINVNLISETIFTINHLARTNKQTNEATTKNNAEKKAENDDQKTAKTLE